LASIGSTAGDIRRRVRQLSIRLSARPPRAGVRKAASGEMRAAALSF